MNRNANFFKLGLFVVVSFLLFAGFLMLFGAGEFFKKELMAETCFDESVQGLDMGSEVKYQGVKIGTVKSITTPARIYNTPSDYVLVTFSISQDCHVGQTGATSEERIKKAIAKGLTINLAFKGLTGAAYLETNYFPDGQTPLDISWTPDHLYIPSRKSNIKRLENALNGILDNLSQINLTGMILELESLLTTLNQKVNAVNAARISDQMESLLKDLKQTNYKLLDTLGSDEFNGMITGAGQAFSGLNTILNEAKGPIGHTLKDFRAAAGNAKAITQGLEQNLSPKLDHMEKQVNTLISSMSQTAKMLETMVWLNADSINETIENFEHTSENLKQLSIEIRQYPARLLLEKPPEQLLPQGEKP